MTGQRKGRYIISWIIIILVIVHWGYARWVSNSMPDTVWDLLIVAIVVSAGYVVFGEDRFSAAIGEAEDVVDGGGSEDEQQDSGGSEDEQQDSGGSEDEQQDSGGSEGKISVG